MVTLTFGIVAESAPAHVFGVSQTCTLEDLGALICQLRRKFRLLSCNTTTE